MTDALNSTASTPAGTSRGSRMAGLRVPFEREELDNELTVLTSLTRDSPNVNGVSVDRKDLVAGVDGASSGEVIHCAASYDGYAGVSCSGGGSPRSRSMLVSSESLSLDSNHKEAEELGTCADRQQGDSSTSNSQNNGAFGGFPPRSSSVTLRSGGLPELLVSSSQNGSNHREWAKEAAQVFERQQLRKQSSFCSSQDNGGVSHHTAVSDSQRRSYESVAAVVKDDGDTLMPCVSSMRGGETMDSANGRQPSCHYTAGFLDGKTISAAAMATANRDAYHELQPPLPVGRGTRQYSPQTLPHSLPHQQRFCSVTRSVSEGNSGSLASSGLSASQTVDGIGGLMSMPLVAETAYSQVGHFLSDAGSSHSQNAPFGVGYYELSRASDQHQQQPEESGRIGRESESPNASVPVVYNPEVSHGGSRVPMQTHIGSECRMPPTSSHPTLTQRDQQDRASILQQQQHVHPAHPVASGHHDSHPLRQASSPHHGALHMMHLGYAQTFGLGPSPEVNVRSSLTEMMLPFTVAPSAQSGSSTSASSRTSNLDVVGHVNEAAMENPTFESGRRSDGVAGSSFGTFYFNSSATTQLGSHYASDISSQHLERRDHNQHQEEVVVAVSETRSDILREQRGEQRQQQKQQLCAPASLRASSVTSGSERFGSESCKASGVPASSGGAALPVKRRRGRPRKHPLPLSSSGSLSVERTVSASCSVSSRAIDGRRGGRPPSQGSGDRLTAGRALNASQEDGAIVDSENRRGRCLGADRVRQHLWSLRALREAYCSEAHRHLQSDTMTSHYQQHEVAEEYVGIGGPFTAMAVAAQLQEVHDLVIERELGLYSSGNGTAKHSTAFKKTLEATAGENEFISLGKERGSVMSQSYLDLQKVFKETLRPEPLAVNLNSSFAWNSFDPRVPVRELAVARHHLAALLNDSRVFVYRHRTHPLVRSRVNEWEHIEPLQGCGIVAVRIASGNLPPNWRQLYHERTRVSLLREIHQGLSRGKRSSVNPGEDYDHISAADVEKLVTEQPSAAELEKLAMQHRSGILCCSSSLLDPDWLPEPFVLAALGQSGIVRIAKCSGYFNYPMIVKTGIASEGHSIQSTGGNDVVDVVSEHPYSKDSHGASPPQALSSTSSASCFTRSVGETMQRIPDVALGEESEEKVTGSQPTLPYGGHANSIPGHQRVLFRVERNSLRIDRVERQPELFIPTKEVNDAGQTVKVRAQVQDVALAELTLDSLLAARPSGGLEVAMVLYALGNNEHSAFVKGKNLYIRFKNFPTGPAKVHCGPLGHSGAVLLANGTVWSWMAQPKAVGNKNGKLGVLIQQVGGSLEGKVVVDFMAIGADFLALTSDGVVHEWNCYAPYLTNPLCPNFCALTIPQSLSRPNIPEPIELTPDFQKKVWGRVRLAPHEPFKVGRFRWFNSPLPAEKGGTSNETVKCSGSAEAGKNVKGESTLGKPGGREQSSDGVMSSSATIVPYNNVDDGTGKPVVNESYYQQKQQQQYSFVAEPKTMSEENDGDQGEHGQSREEQKTKTAVDTENMSCDTWESSDYWSEEALERHRQKEIKRLYFFSSANDSRVEVPDPIQRIFILEGITFFFRGTSNSFSYVTNTLGDYHSGTAHPCWSGPFGVPQTFNVLHANCFVRTFGNLGKPFLTNPVVVARMKLPPDLTNEQLRHQLEMMAGARLPPYRLLLSPTSLCVGVLRCWDVAEEEKRLASALPGPVSLLACHPERYLEIFSGLRKEFLQSAVPERENEMVGSLERRTTGIKCDIHEGQPSRQQLEGKSGNNGRTEADGATEDGAALENCVEHHHNSWRATGAVRRGNRVGRPRGSRLASRGAYMSQRALLPLRRATLSAVRQLVEKETLSQQDEQICAENSESPSIEKTLVGAYENHCSSSTCVGTSLESVARSAVQENAVVQKEAPQTHNASTARTGEPRSPKTNDCEQEDRREPGRKDPVEANPLKDVLRKRPRRHSSALEDDRFFTDFVDGEESDKAWEQMLQTIDGETAETAETAADNSHKQHESAEDTTGSSRRRRRRCGSYGPRNFGTRGRRRGRGSASHVGGHNRGENAAIRAADVSTSKSDDTSILEDSPACGLQNASEPEEVGRRGLHRIKKAVVNKLMVSRGRAKSSLRKARVSGRPGRKAYNGRFNAIGSVEENEEGSGSPSSGGIEDVNAPLEEVPRKTLPWKSKGRAAGEDSCAELNEDIRTLDGSDSDRGSVGGAGCLVPPLKGAEENGKCAVDEETCDAKERSFFVCEERHLGGLIKTEALNGVAHTECSTTATATRPPITGFVSSTDSLAAVVNKDTLSTSIRMESLTHFQGLESGLRAQGEVAVNGAPSEPRFT